MGLNWRNTLRNFYFVFILVVHLHQTILCQTFLTTPSVFRCDSFHITKTSYNFITTDKEQSAYIVSYTDVNDTFYQTHFSTSTIYQFMVYSMDSIAAFYSYQDRDSLFHNGRYYIHPDNSYLLLYNKNEFQPYLTGYKCMTDSIAVYFYRYFFNFELSRTGYGTGNLPIVPYRYVNIDSLKDRIKDSFYFKPESLTVELVYGCYKEYSSGNSMRLVKKDDNVKCDNYRKMTNIFRYNGYYQTGINLLGRRLVEMHNKNTAGTSMYIYKR